ncbi:hypothetical protein ABPG72_016928 [Tetrahymena utriculariae]
MAPHKKKILKKNQDVNHASNNQKEDTYIDDMNIIQLIANTFDRLFQCYTRSKILSYILYIVYSAQLMSILLSQKVVDNFFEYYNYSIIKTLSTCLQYFQLFPSIVLYSSTSFQLQFTIYFSLIVNVTLMIIFIINCVYFKATGFFQDYVQQNNKTMKVSKGIPHYVLSYFNLLFCFVIKIYNYILWIPFINSCSNLIFNQIKANTISYVFAICSSILTILIASFSRIFDKNHSFQINCDLLAQRKNKYKYICLATEILILTIKSLDVLQFYLILHVLVSLLRLIYLLIELPFFLNKRMDLIMLNQVLFYFFQSVVICALGINKTKSLKQVDYILISCLTIPITLKIANSIFQYKIKYILGSITSIENIDLKVKQNTFADVNMQTIQKFIYILNSYSNLAIEDYMQEGNGIIFESLFLNHTKNCQIRKQSKQKQVINFDRYCFCEKYGNINYDQISRQDMMGVEQRKKFLIGYINYLFDNINSSRSMKQIKDIEMQSCYTYFQMEIAKTPQKAYSQIIQLQNILQKSNNSFWVQFQITQLINAIFKDFSGFFNSNEYQNQRLNIHLVFEFEQIYYDLKKVIKLSLQGQQRFYEYLNQDSLHLQTLQKIGNSCLQNARDIESKLIQIFDIHPSHQRTFSLAEIFQEFFDFRKRPARYFASRSKHKLKNKLIKFDTKINLFMKNTCSIFISLSDQKKIMRITNTTSKFFKCTNLLDLIGKPLAVLQPEWIQDKMQQMLTLLQDEGDMYLIKLGEYFTFMRDLKLNIFPVMLRAQMCIISNQQLGLSLFIQKLDNYEKYIVCNSSFQILNRKENFIFQNFKLSLQVLDKREQQDLFKDRDIRHIIPYLLALKLSEINDANGLEEFEEKIGVRKIQNSQSQIYTTLFMMPKDPEKLNCQEKFQNDNNPYSIEKYLNQLDIFSYNFSAVTFSLYKIKDQKNQLNDLLIIEVIKIKQIRRISELNEQLQHLQINLQNKFPTYNLKVPILSQNQLLEQKFQQNSQVDLEDYGQNLKKNSLNELAAKATQSELERKGLSSLLTQVETNQFEDKQQKIQNEQNLENLLLQSESRVNHFCNLSSNRHLSNQMLTQIDLPSTKRISEQQITLGKQNVSYSFQHLLQPTQTFQESPSKIASAEDNCVVFYEPIYLDNFNETNQQQKSLQKIQSFSKFEKQKFINQNADYINNQIHEQEDEEEKNQNFSQVSNADQIVNFGMEDDCSEESSTKEQKKQVVDDSCSINSTQSQIFSKRRSLFDMVLRSKKSKEIVLAKSIGFISLLVILFVTVFLYFQLDNYLNLETKYYQNLLIGPQLFEEYLQILRGTEIQTIIGIDQIYHFLPASKYNISDYLFVKNESKIKLSNITTGLGDFQQNLVSNGLEDQLISISGQIILDNMMTKSIYNVTFIRLYQLLNLPSNIRQYSYYGTIDSRTYVYSNYQSFIDIFSGILETQGNLANDQLQNTKDLIILSFVIYEIACFLSSLIILPLYFIIQQKNENILKLFSTFNSELLRFMIEKYRTAGNLDLLNVQNQQNFVKRSSLKSKNDKEQFSMLKNQQQIYKKNILKKSTNANNSPQQLVKKKRQVSKTNSLQKFSIKVSMISLLVFFTISIYSILNYLITKDFFNYFTYNIQELSLIAQTKSQLSLSYTAVDLLYNSYAYNFTESDVNQILYAFNQFVDVELNEKIQQLQSVQQYFATNSRNFIPNYMDILLQTLNTNACSILSSDYLNTYSNLHVVNGDKNSYQNCLNAYLGILPQGLIVSLNLAIQKFKALEQLYISTRNNIKMFLKKVAMWDLQNNFKQFDYFYYQIRIVLETLTQFMLSSSKDYIQYLQYIQFVLFLYSVCVTTIILFFLWNKYVTWIDQSVFKTISLLSLVPIENQLENPYIVSYLNKEKSKMKQDH